MMRQTVCDVTKAVISEGENIGELQLLVRDRGSDVELQVSVRCRPDGSRPDLSIRAIRVMVERGEISPAPHLAEELQDSAPQKRQENTQRPHIQAVKVAR